MAIIKVNTQEELSRALIERKPGDDVELHGNGSFEIHGSSQVTACGSSQVTAYDSSQVRACGSSQVTAYDSSQVRACGSSQVTACGSSQVRACGSSQVRACGSSQVRAYDSSQVTASKQVAVTIHGKDTKVTGGIKIKYVNPKTAKDWIANYGLKSKDGVVILYKGLNDDFTSPHGTSYAPGTMPEAKDWDGGKVECGRGLHFSPHPFMTLRFHAEAKRFVACPVKVSEIVVHPNGSYPEKVKAPRVCAPTWEVDINGDRVNATAPAGASHA